MWKARETRVYTEDGGFDIRCLPKAVERAAFIVKAVNSHKALVKALHDIITANNEFRKGMPDGWEGDPLQDACHQGAKLLLDLKPESEHVAA